MAPLVTYNTRGITGYKSLAKRIGNHVGPAPHPVPERLEDLERAGRSAAKWGCLSDAQCISIRKRGIRFLLVELKREPWPKNRNTGQKSLDPKTSTYPWRFGAGAESVAWWAGKPRLPSTNARGSNHQSKPPTRGNLKTGGTTQTGVPTPNKEHTQIGFSHPKMMCVCVCPFQFPFKFAVKRVPSKFKHADTHTHTPYVALGLNTEATQK